MNTMAAHPNVWPYVIMFEFDLSNPFFMFFLSSKKKKSKQQQQTTFTTLNGSNWGVGALYTMSDGHMI